MITFPRQQLGISSSFQHNLQKKAILSANNIQFNAINTILFIGKKVNCQEKCVPRTFHNICCTAERYNEKTQQEQNPQDLPCL